MEDRKTEKIKDDNLYLSFVEISKNLNLGQNKKNIFRASASRANKLTFSDPNNHVVLNKKQVESFFKSNFYNVVASKIP